MVEILTAANIPNDDAVSNEAALQAVGLALRVVTVQALGFLPIERRVSADPAFVDDLAADLASDRATRLL